MFRIKFSREVVLKLLYQMDVSGLTGIAPEAILQSNLNFFKGINEVEKDFVLKIVAKVQEEQESIDRLISQHLIGWKLSRLNTVDRNLLRMGIAESYFNSEKAIIIDDVVRIAKKYGGQDSYRIINAVLDKVLK
jgi:N utilization substance protein B